jgi:hypothetical protein
MRELTIGAFKNVYLDTELNSAVLCYSIQASESQIRVFKFDRIYDAENTTDEIYQENIDSLVEGSVNGVNATVIAYGQTGSGKNFTIYGADREEPELEGIVIEASRKLFDLLREQYKSVVRMEFLEIYNEKARDLIGENENTYNDRKEGLFKGTYEVEC